MFGWVHRVLSQAKVMQPRGRGQAPWERRNRAFPRSQATLAHPLECAHLSSPHHCYHGLALASLLCTPSPSPLSRSTPASPPSLTSSARPSQCGGSESGAELACGGALVGAWGGGRPRRRRVEAWRGHRAMDVSLPHVAPTHRRRTSRDEGIPLLRGSGSPTAVTSRPGIDLAWWRHRGSDLLLTRGALAE